MSTSDSTTPDGATPFGSRYVLLGLLGRGSMGRVYRGQIRDTGESVAVKVLRDDLASQPDIVARFIQERQVLRAVDHPNVVGVRDLVVEGEQLGIVMDLVSGGDLRTAVRVPIPADQALALTAQIADGLGAVHAANVVHRDLKPENVLADRWPDGTLRPRLTDFGVSRLISQSMTKVTSLIGTPGYLSPESARGQRAESPADIYSLGVMLYEMTCNRPPFVADNVIALIRAHAEDVVPRPTGMPNELWALLQAMLAKQPEQRPTAPQVADAARRLLPACNGLGPFVVPASSTPASEATIIRPTPLPADTVVRPSPSLPVGGDEPTAVASDGQSRNRKRRAALIGAASVLVLGAAALAAVLVTSGSGGGSKSAGAESPGAAATAASTTTTTKSGNTASNKSSGNSSTSNSSPTTSVQAARNSTATTSAPVRSGGSNSGTTATPARTTTTTTTAPLVSVPDLSGMTEIEVRHELRPLGLTTSLGDPVSLPYGDSRSGRVILQNPSAGQLTVRGGAITVRFGLASTVAPTTTTTTTVYVPPPPALQGSRGGDASSYCSGNTNCRWVNVTGQNFTPYSTVTFYCGSGLAEGNHLNVNGSGSFYGNSWCFTDGSVLVRAVDSGGKWTQIIAYV